MTLPKKFSTTDEMKEKNQAIFKLDREGHLKLFNYFFNKNKGLKALRQMH